MIGFFPTPYPDELFYSICARYHTRSKNRAAVLTFLDLFGQEKARISLDFPNQLKQLIDRLPSGHNYTVDRFINENSLFPFYQLFLPPDRVQMLREHMAENQHRGTIQAKVGILTSQFDIEYLRFCPVCVCEDRAEFGETYWHRVHQIPGIFVCHRHQVFLEESSVSAHYQGRKDNIINANDAVDERESRYLGTDDKDHKFLLHLAIGANWLLNQKDFQTCGQAFFRKRYLNELFFIGLGSYSGTVLMTELHKKFEEFYSTDFLSAISCDLDKKYTWLKRILNELYKASPPIKHMLLILFLGYSIEEFVKLPESITPFGKPPFPCLNAAAAHFGELRIKYCDVKKTNVKKIGATFACDCGFAYRRYGLDGTGQRRYEYDLILSFGDVWLEKLRGLDRQGHNVARKSAELKVSTSTIKSALKRFPSEEFNSRKYRVGNAKFPSEKIEMMRKANRAEWLKIRKENPELGRGMLRKNFSTVTNWLSLMDRDWYEENAPTRRISRNKPARYDWKKRDQEYTRQAEYLASEIYNSFERPVRVTVNCLAQKLRIGHILSKRPHLLPETRSILEKLSESSEEFIARRIIWAADYFIKEKVFAGKTKIHYKVGVMRPHLLQLPKVQAAFAQAIAKVMEAHASGWICD